MHTAASLRRWRLCWASVSCVLGFAVSSVLAWSAFAAAGDYDASFGGDGVVHTNFASDSGADVGANDEAFGLALQSDGKLVAVGRAAGSGGRFALARYDVNGTLDRTFGND